MCAPLEPCCPKCNNALNTAAHYYLCISPTKPMKYQTNPIIVDAIQLTKSNFAEVCDFAGEQNIADGTCLDEGYIEIHTKDATTDCRTGEWLVKHPNGNFSTWTDEDFHKTYNLVFV